MSEKPKYMPNPEEEAENIVFNKQEEGNKILDKARDIVAKKQEREIQAEELTNFFKKAQEKGGKRPEIIINKNNDKNKLKGFEKLISKN